MSDITRNGWVVASQSDDAQDGHWTSCEVICAGQFWCMGL